MQGLLLLDKPEGITSFGAVAAVKRAAHEKRVGHTGTLDPMATGVLPVLIGKATVLSSLLLDADKCYQAVIKLGVVTDTDDISGTVIAENQVNVTNDKLISALNHFIGKISQKPPMYSALKQDGVRLYKLAREGKTVDIPEREITIHSINLIDKIDEDNCFSIEVYVSKGTYIRSLARDIGNYLGCGACIYSLRRTFTGGFSLDNCVPLNRLNSDNIEEYILSEETAVSHLREAVVTEKQAFRFCNGGQLSLDRLNIMDTFDGEMIRVKYGSLFLGVGIIDTKAQLLKIKCIINYPEAVEE